MNRLVASLVIGVALAGCGASEEPHEFPDAHDPAYAASFDENRDPRVSTSAGDRDGVIVLWPRVVPASEERSADAGRMQARLRELAVRALPGKAIDVRPEPERVCPSTGCVALALGAVLVHRGEGCSAAATISLPGESPMRIVPWTDGVRARSTTIPFREPPESQLMVGDLVRCSEIEASLAGHEEEVFAALQETAGVTPSAPEPSEAAPDPSDAEQADEEAAATE